MFSLPFFHVNTVTVSGALVAKDLIQDDLLQLTVRSYVSGTEFLVFASGDYVLGKVQEIEVNSPVEFGCAIRKFPNGDFLCVQSVNALIGSFAGLVSFVDTPRTTASGDTVVNFSLSQSTKDDEQYIRCSLWKRANGSSILMDKIVKGAHVTVSGTVKPGSYQKDGETISTLDVTVNHVASAKGGVTPGFSATAPRLGAKPTTPIASSTPSPVGAAAGDDVEF